MNTSCFRSATIYNTAHQPNPGNLRTFLSYVVSAGLSALAALGSLPFEAGAADYMFWTERSATPGVTDSSIRRAKLDGSEVTTVFPTSSPIDGLALDPIGGYLYTGDLQWLFRLNLDGTGRVNLVPAIDQVKSISLDAVHGKIYWAEGAHGGNAIRMANLDGSNPQTLIAVGSGGLFTIALDPASKLYFMYNINAGSDTIQSMNLDGSGITTIYDLGGPNFDSDDMAIDLGRGRLYQTGFGQDGIFEMSVDGSTPYSLLLSTPNGANGGLCFDEAADNFYYFNANATAIEVVHRDGTGHAVLVTGVPLGMHIKVGHGLPCLEGLTFNGFLPPIGGADATGGSFDSPVRTFKMKSTIPLKFTLSCSGTAVLDGIHTLEAIKWSNQTTPEPPLDATPTDAATTGNEFRLVSGQWQFNLDTAATGMSVGKWELIATLSDQSQHSVWIQLR